MDIKMDIGRIDEEFRLLAQLSLISIKTLNFHNYTTSDSVVVIMQLCCDVYDSFRAHPRIHKP